MWTYKQSSRRACSRTYSGRPAGACHAPGDLISPGWMRAARSRWRAAGAGAGRWTASQGSKLRHLKKRSYDLWGLCHGDAMQAACGISNFIAEEVDSCHMYRKHQMMCTQVSCIILIHGQYSAKYHQYCDTYALETRLLTVKESIFSSSSSVHHWWCCDNIILYWIINVDLEFIERCRLSSMYWH